MLGAAVLKQVFKKIAAQQQCTKKDSVVSTPDLEERLFRKLSQNTETKV